MIFKPLRVLKDYGGTRITLGRDFKAGTYLIEKSVTTDDAFVFQLWQNERKFYQGHRHPNILKFYGEGQSSLSFLTEYAPFGNVISFLTENPSESVLWKFIGHLLSSVRYLHATGTVHNDISPDNLLVCEHQTCKLSDFAMTGRIGSPAFPDRPATFRMGTEGFRLKADIREHQLDNDIYALGEVLSLMLRTILDDPTQAGGTGVDRIAHVAGRCITCRYTSIDQIIADLELSLPGNI